MVLLSPPPEILASFGIEPHQPFRRTTGGHINDTFIFGDPPAFVVQRISRTYFDDPEAVMENLVRIVGHLGWKVRFSDDEQNERWFPELHHTTSGKHYLYAEDGSLWRALRYIPGRAPTFEPAPELMTKVAAMYGRFLAGVNDLDGPELRPTVGWYRDLDAIRLHFEGWLHSASAEQLAAIDADRSDLAFLEQWVAEREASLDPGAFRRRAVHNDTKLDNVLMRPESGEIVAVIDLDVAMQGQASHDFGDLLRSANQSGREPDRTFDPELFRALASGFITGAGSSLSDAEISALPSAGARICLELGMRYLMDFLSDKPALQPDPHVALAKGRRNLRLARGIIEQVDALDAMVLQLAEHR